MNESLRLSFCKFPVTSTRHADSPFSLISGTWMRRHGVAQSAAGRVSGFLTLQAADRPLHMHINVAAVEELSCDLALCHADLERYEALASLACSTRNCPEESAIAKFTLLMTELLPSRPKPILLSLLSHVSASFFTSRAALQQKLHIHSPWFDVNECIVRQALLDISRPLLTALLNKMQSIMLIPNSTPPRKVDIISTLIIIYQSLVEVCRLSDPNDLCGLLNIPLDQVPPTKPAFIHSVFSRVLGPGLCRTVMRLHCATLVSPAPLSAESATMLESLRLLPTTTLRQLLSTANCLVSSKCNKDLAAGLALAFLNDASTLATLTEEQVWLFLISVKPDLTVNDVLDQNRDRLHDLFLRCRYGGYLVACFRLRIVVFPDLMREPREKDEEDESVWAATVSHVEENWPSLPPRSVIHNCMVNYQNALDVTPALVCAVCSRQSHRLFVGAYFLQPQSVLESCLRILRTTDPHLQKYFNSKVNPSAHVQIVKGAILDTRGIVKYPDAEVLQICKGCVGTLLRDKMPSYALANNLYVGELPSEFHDVTWAEEQICALFRLHAYIIRLFASDEAHRKLFGNTCAFPQNTVSTAAALPRTPADITGNITVVFIGSRKPTTAELLKYKQYTVRRGLVWRLLLYLYEYHLFYQGLPPPRPELLSEYPEYGLLPGFEERIIWDRESDAKAVFEQETAGMSMHPATEFAQSAVDQDKDTQSFYLECTGVTDPNLQNIPARHLEQAAISNLAKPCSPDAVLTPAVKPPGSGPDLLISRGSDPANDYNNPGLFPGMFPTLFPLGIGGFEDPFRPVKLKFLRQAEHLMDLATRSFRRHPTYMFAALNIHQRRQVNLRTHLAISRHNFRHIAPRLNAVSSATLDQLATRIEQENWATNLSKKESEAMFLFRQVSTIAAKIPGSEAMKAHLRGNIRAYFQFFGLPHLFLTINPSPIHSPVFQFRVGDHTIDLSTQYPILPSRHVRALRVAEDPMEASDFYQWCLEIIYEYLFGWDRAKRRSRPEGGILGHLLAFYIINELTERGFFHGHGIVWLLGAPNPDELHARLSCPEFQRRFFEFYESIIYNHFPDVDAAMPATYNCSQELPPRPPAFQDIQDISSPMAQRWQQVLDYETKICATDCQLHKCRPVCHKYKNDGVCRFNFPLEVVPTSYYDPERKAVVMRLLDPWVNYYNPIIMTFCRHNHDIKWMLSGRAGRAIIIYVTNYITKMEFKTQHALSLLSKAVAAIQGTEGSPVRQAQVLLQKCLTQFTRRQQVHAQQACRYLRGYDDSIPSHKTLPLLSHLLLAFVHETYPGLVDSDAPSDIYVPLRRGDDGHFRDTSQVKDYYYRGDELKHLNFYDFVRLVECVKRCEKDEKTDEMKDEPVGNNVYYVELRPEHQLSKTHHLLVRPESATPFCGNVRVPLMIGTFPPRPHSAKYPLFVAAHFKPFGPDVPLGTNMLSLAESMQDYPFNDVAKRVMKNWEAFHECEDERDAERLRKRERHAHVAVNDVARWQQKGDDCHDSVVFDVSSIKQTSSHVEQVGRDLIATFHLANWFETYDDNGSSGSSSMELHRPYELSSGNVKQWLHTLSEADKAAKVRRRSANTIETMQSMTPSVVNATIVGTSGLNSRKRTMPTTIITNEHQGQNVTDIEGTIVRNFKLNARQTIAFKIIANQFLRQYVHKVRSSEDEPPFNLLLTGPGGTGKSHVIKALKDLMKHYGMGHAIRLLAPTGTTAAVISGMTIHSGLKIGFKTSRIEGEDTIHVQYTTSVSNRRLLREEFKDAKVIFIDEVSLIPQELVAEVDAALREATETDQWMGGLMIIYAGDFGQYPPVGGTPLYHPIRSGVQAQSASQIKARLGRLVWKRVNGVIALSEQERMKQDAEYAAAVSRLRLRCCIPADVDLFNSRLLKGLENPGGVDLSKTPYVDKGIAIVDTNHARQMLNLHKARAAASRCGEPLTLCAARDCIKDNDMDAEMRNELLNIEISSQSKSDFLPGFIPCYIGMPVILRHKNLSTELGVTNGAQGFLRQMNIDTDGHGHSFCTVALIEFPDSNVDIPGLPKKWVPILPRTCRFKVQLSNSVEQVWVTRSQLPISPSFAVTGHSSQGKTLPVVITNLKSGGFAAYVAASRPTTRFGLVITQRVTLEDLNKPLPLDLRNEYDRLLALEHNTLVKFGFLSGPLLPVPDAEGETLSTSQKLIVRPAAESGRTAQKRKGDHGPSDQSAIKRLRQTADGVNSIITPGSTMAGPLWDKENWSCTYDVFLMSLLAHLRHVPSSTAVPHLRNVLGDSFVGTLMEFAARWGQLSSTHITRLRDHLRDILSQWRPQLFPRQGSIMISASHLFELLLPVPPIHGLGTGSFIIPRLLYLSPEHHPGTDTPVHLERWLLDRLPPQSGSSQSEKLPLPSVLHFEIIPPLSVQVPSTLHLFGRQYQLSAAVYHGDGHYVSSVEVDKTWYTHDGMAHEGRAVAVPSFATSIGPDEKSINLVTYHSIELTGAGC